MSNRDDHPLHTHRVTQPCHKACPGYSPPDEPVAQEPETLADMGVPEGFAPLGPPATHNHGFFGACESDCPLYEEVPPESAREFLKRVFPDGPPAGPGLGVQLGGFEPECHPPVTPEGEPDGGAHGDNLTAGGDERYTFLNMNIGSPLPEKIRAIAEKVAADINAKIRERLAEEGARAAGFLADEPVGTMGPLTEDAEGLRAPFIIRTPEGDGPTLAEQVEKSYRALEELASELVGHTEFHSHEIGEVCVGGCPVYHILMERGLAEAKVQRDHHNAMLEAANSGAGILYLPEGLNVEEEEGSGDRGWHVGFDEGFDTGRASGLRAADVAVSQLNADLSMAQAVNVEVSQELRAAQAARAEWQRLAEAETERAAECERELALGVTATAELQQALMDERHTRRGLEHDITSLIAARNAWQTQAERNDELLHEKRIAFETQRTSIEHLQHEVSALVAQRDEARARVAELEHGVEPERVEIQRVRRPIAGGMTIDGVHIPGDKFLEGFEFDEVQGTVAVTLVIGDTIEFHYEELSEAQRIAGDR